MSRKDILYVCLTFFTGANIGILSTIVFHELGHAAVGYALGKSPKAIYIYPTPRTEFFDGIISLFGNIGASFVLLGSIAVELVLLCFALGMLGVIKNSLETKSDIFYLPHTFFIGFYFGLFPITIGWTGLGAPLGLSGSVSMLHADAMILKTLNPSLITPINGFISAILMLYFIAPLYIFREELFGAYRSLGIVKGLKIEKIRTVGEKITRPQRIGKWISKHIEGFFWSLIILILLFLVYLSAPIKTWNLPEDARWNLSAEIFGIVLTIIFLYIMLNKKDWYKWRSVDKMAHDLLRREVGLVYTDVSIFLEGATAISGSGSTKAQLDESFRREYYRKLKSRAEAPELQLRENASELSKGKLDEVFKHRIENLNKLEQKYSTFFDPKIVHSIAVIENGLYESALYISLFKQGTIDKNEFLSNLKYSLHPIVREVYELQTEHGLETLRFPISIGE